MRSNVSFTCVRGAALAAIAMSMSSIAIAQDQLMPQQPATQAGAASATTDGPQTLNLRNADINVLIATVAEITGKNFIVDPRV